MIKLNIHLVLIFLMFLSTPFYSNAQNNNINSNDKSTKCGYCVNDGKSHAHTSPYAISFKKEIPYFAVSLGLFGTERIIARNEDDPFTVEELGRLNPSNINRIDRGATRNNSSNARTVSDIVLYSSGALPLYFLSNHHTKKDFIPLLVISIEVAAITSGLTRNTKFLVNRARPLTYNPDFSIAERTNSSSKLSFFSGHTAQTAAFSVMVAKVINDYHPNLKPGLKVGIWGFALTLPAITAYSRVKGGNHFVTDVLTGYAVGAAVGWLVPHLHKKKVDSKLSLAPFNYDGANGLSLTWKL